MSLNTSATRKQQSVNNATLAMRMPTRRIWIVSLSVGLRHAARPSRPEIGDSLW
jgi:hypothetical protein